MTIPTWRGLRRRLWPRLGLSTLRVAVREETLTMIVDTPMAWERAEHYATAEPETLDWLDQMAPGEILFDVGANIGIYGLYAAARGIQVLAFEPEALNAGRLQQHIAINGFVGRITPYVVAITNQSGLDLLHLHGPAVATAAALHAFGAPVDYAGRPFTAVAKQGVYGTSLDDLIERGLPVPTYLKST